MMYLAHYRGWKTHVAKGFSRQYTGGDDERVTLCGMKIRYRSLHKFDWEKFYRKDWVKLRKFDHTVVTCDKCYQKLQTHTVRTLEQWRYS